MFRHVTVTQLRPAILGAASIVFVFTFTSYGVIRIVAAPGTRTIEVEVWRNATQLGRLGQAAVLALVQLAILAAAVAWATRLQRTTSRAITLDDAARRDHPRTAGQRRFVATAAVATAVVLLAPLAALVSRSLRTPTGWSTVGVDAPRAARGPSRNQPRRRPGRRDPRLADHRRRRDDDRRRGRRARPARRSPRPVGSAGSSTPGRRLPIATSAVTIGFGMLITFGTDPVDWRGSWWLVPVGQALVALPFVIRNCVSVLRAVDPALSDAAATLGASPSRAWWEIVVPNLWRPLAGGAALAAAISLGEFGATSLLSRSGNETMPIVIEQLLGRTGSILQAQGYVLATMLAAMTILLVALVEFATGDAFGTGRRWKDGR